MLRLLILLFTKVLTVTVETQFPKCIPRVWQNIYFYCSNYVGNQFIIAIRHLGGLWYKANKPGLYPGTPCCIMHKNSPSQWYIGHIPHPFGPYCLSVTHWCYSQKAAEWSSQVLCAPYNPVNTDKQQPNVCLEQTSSYAQHLLKINIVNLTNYHLGWPFNIISISRRFGVYHCSQIKCQSLMDGGNPDLQNRITQWVR